MLPTTTTLLVAVSGGADSMVLLDVLRKSTIGKLVVAHCNFGLRGEESNADEQLVRDYCTQHAMVLEVMNFNTYEYIQTHKIGIQEAARDLRYQWFNELLLLHNLHYIAVAHNANDQAETIVYKLARGAGLQGMQGMAAISNSIVRPLLQINRDEIEHYASTHNLLYSNDSSNASNKYSRNYIRHNVTPLLQHINSKAVQHINNTAIYITQANVLLQESVAKIKKLVVCNLPNYVVCIDINELHNHTQNYTYYLYYLLLEYHLNETQHNNILQALALQQSGAVFTTTSHKLCVHNNCVHTISIDKCYAVDVLIENEIATKMLDNTLLKITTGNQKTGNYFDANTLKFPLHIRHWQVGDSIQPMGMNGKSKLVSDVLTHKKLSVIQKQQQLVVISNTMVLCVIDCCTAHWARVTTATQKIFSVNTLQY
jgi:tRNA(Ile)-lysidine synthase